MRLKPRAAIDALATFLVAAAALFVLWAQIEARWIDPRQNEQIQEIHDSTLKANALRNAKGGGEVVLVEFTDYECPFCARHAQEVEPALNALVTSNQLRYAVFHFPLEQAHRNARQAATAAECAAEQSRFWEMHQILFHDQKNLGPESFTKSAQNIGLDLSSFSHCLGGDVDRQITNDVAEGRRLGVTSTPTFFVGRVGPDGNVALVKRIKGFLPSSALLQVVADVRSARTDQTWLSSLTRIFE